MDRVEDMRTFVAELTTNHGNRSQQLHGLSTEVQATLQTFQANRKATAAEMQAMLEKARNERTEAVATIQAQTQAFIADVNAARQTMSTDMFDSLRVAHDQLSGSVADLLAQYGADRKAMSEAEQAALAAARAERQAQVAAIQADAQATVQRIAGEREAMAETLNSDLAESRAQREATVAGLLAEFQAMVERIAVDNRNAAEELRSFLSKDNAERNAAVTEIMAGISADRQAMSQAQVARLNDFKGALVAEVNATIGGFAKDRIALNESLREMGDVWREYAAAMRGQTAPQSVAPTEPVAEVEEPEVSDSGDVERDILDYLATKPEGAKLVEMEPVFGLSRPVIGRQLRMLVDAGKVVKDPDTLLYKLA